jgi:Arc/MetJ family transcription regulator
MLVLGDSGNQTGLPRRLSCCDTHKYAIFTHSKVAMRTNIDIDDRLMSQAMRRSGARTKKAAVEAGLRLLAQTHAQVSIRRLRGKVEWSGDLSQSRTGRSG